VESSCWRRTDWASRPMSGLSRNSKGMSRNSLSSKSITLVLELLVFTSPPGQKDRALRKAILRYVDSRVRIAGENGELVAMGGDFNPATSNCSGCSETGGVCVPVPVTPTGNTWIANGSRPRRNDFWLTYSKDMVLLEGGSPRTLRWKAQFEAPDASCAWRGG
jgi:hypothetical protein